ncbi:prostamide/prostaglandin F synthase-like isoform X2 [Eleginops maclovinus]|uniref:prostamide/prostaglandin F synthase-like isoform X2 n=1 Tax=Eleginops maclovinus TaxID=56733 RepID=UPI003080E247
MSEGAAGEALRVFVKEGKVLLELAEQESREGAVQDFIRQKISIERRESLLGLIEAAARLYRRSLNTDYIQIIQEVQLHGCLSVHCSLFHSLSVKRIQDAEDFWRRNTHCAALQDALQDLQQLQWDAFLQRLDAEAKLGTEALHRDQQLKHVPAETRLRDARTGRAVTLQQYLGGGKKILLVLIRQFSCLLCRLHLQHLQDHQSTLDAHSVKVVVVSFGCEGGASHWLQETGCQYDLLLDPERKLYAAFGLGASVWKVLNFSNMLLYAEYVVNSLPFPRGLPNIQEDMFQLGGDFVVDEHGGVLFSHCCQSPTDRPPLQDIISAL